MTAPHIVPLSTAPGRAAPSRSAMAWMALQYMKEHGAPARQCSPLNLRPSRPVRMYLEEAPAPTPAPTPAPVVPSPLPVVPAPVPAPRPVPAPANAPDYRGAAAFLGSLCCICGGLFGVIHTVSTWVF